MATIRIERYPDMLRVWAVVGSGRKQHFELLVPVLKPERHPSKN
jgi:hypothetical protein